MPKPPPPAIKDDSEDIQAILRTRQERRQRRQVVEAAQTPIRERLEAEEGRDSSDPVQTRQQPIVPKKGVDVPPRRRLSREQRGPWARQEESVVGREPADGQKGVSEESAVPEKTTALEKRQGSEKTSISERMALSENVAASEKKPVLEKTGTSEKLPAPRKTSGSQRRLVSEKASIFEKSPVSETKLVPKRAARSEQPQAQEPPAAGGRQATTTELKTRALPEKSPLPSAEPAVPTSPTVASRLPPITLQVGSAPTQVASDSRAVCCPPTFRPMLAFSPYLLTAPVRIGDTEAGQRHQLCDGEDILIQLRDPRTPADWGNLRSFQKPPWKVLPGALAL